MIVFNDPRAIEMISDAAHVLFIHGQHQCFARRGRDGSVLGGVIFEGYNRASIQIHVAGFAPNWLNRLFLSIVFDYSFNQLNVKKIIGIVKESNQHALRFDLKLGFVQEARIEDMFEDGAALIISMRREQCRFLPSSRDGVCNG